MATTTGRKTTNSRGRTTTKGRTARVSSKNVKNRKKQREQLDQAVKNELILIGIFAAAIFLFLCNINIIKGDVGEFVRSILFGLFGILAYLFPIICFVLTAFGMSNRGNTIAVLKIVACVVLIFMIGMIATLLTGQINQVDTQNVIKSFYAISNRGLLSGGGVIFGGLTYFLYSHIGMGGTIFLILVLGVVSVVTLTEKSFINGIKKGSHIVYESTSESINRHRERMREEYEAYDDDDDDEDDIENQIEAFVEEIKPEKKLRMEKKARGVIPSVTMTEKQPEPKIASKDDIHEIIWKDDMEETVPEQEPTVEENPFKTSEYSDFDQYEKIEIRSLPTNQQHTNESIKTEYEQIREPLQPQEQKPVLDLSEMPEPITENSQRELEQPAFSENEMQEVFVGEDVYPKEEFVTDYQENRKLETESAMIKPVQNTVDAKKEIPTNIPNPTEESKKPELPKEYIFPPISLLKKGEKKSSADSSNELKETAYHLQQTLKTFGVNVTVTDISQGPAVTRFELQPEQGVKVSKIVGLSDDIKLNLAATDIRIEAPIPGKAAVGIEVPNKENSAVAFRDLIESVEFQQFPSNIAFAVGKDIGGKTVVTDIAKAPHLLIAGATGSGKSVCINTIIMGILYKAKPEDVKLIMIDPKVVELSIYNGIPHLMIPVVTDPKKAAAALQWAVSEMTDRYNKFAEVNVRDMKGYNKAVENGLTDENGEPMKKMPQLVIIVDELADLMMVASNDVETAICRLAQLARAAGIHLIIATQRPSVDVITGLIKANMPSRIAFSVSSGVDSRTILDINGAEKLLGKGDMLFYPQGYSKPARVQGAFVSDSEVADVVDFIKNQALGNTYKEGLDEQINNMKSSSGASSGQNEVDSYFVEAGKFVIEKDKASIGMLQRVFKIGFNRAARIVDQLEEAGVVGAEEGTKPRKILMSLSEFENYVEEYL